jgi:hypothetical protein
MNPANCQNKRPSLSALCLELLIISIVLSPVGAGSSIFGKIDDRLDRWFLSDASYSYDIAQSRGIYVAVGRNILQSTNLVRWTVAKRNALLYSVASISEPQVPSYFVAVGHQGTMLRSSDGMTWNSLNSGSAEDLQGICYGAGTLIAVGPNTILVSMDQGLTWATRPAPIPNGERIRYLNNRFIILGAAQLGGTSGEHGSAEYASSPDGLAWVTGRTPPLIFPQDIVYGNQTYLALGGGSGNPSYPTLAISSDLMNWTSPSPTPGAWFRSGTFAYDQFVAVSSSAGQILTSTNGINWVEHAFLGRELRSVIASPYGFVAAGDGVAYSDLVAERAPVILEGFRNQTASEGSSIELRAHVLGATIGGVQWVKDGAPVAGQQGETLLLQRATTNDSGSYSVVLSNRFGMAVSRAARLSVEKTNQYDHWFFENPLLPREFLAIAAGKGIYVGVDVLGRLFTSANLTNWNMADVGTSSVADVTFANDRFIAVGANGHVLTSYDGQVWTLHSSGTSDSLKSVHAAAGLIIAGGANGIVLRSSDGISWRSQSLGHTNSIVKVHYGAGRFFLAADDFDAYYGSRQLFTSVDGLNWTQHETGSPWLVNDITAGNGKLIVALFDRMFDSSMLVSTNGQTWIEIPQQDLVLLHLTAFGDAFYAVGWLTQTGNQGLFKSVDGTTWTPVPVPLDWVDMVIAVPNRLVLTGEGTLIWSEDALTWTQASNVIDNVAADLKGAATGNGLTIVAGDWGGFSFRPVVYSRTNKMQWGRISTQGLAGPLTAVSYGKNCFIASGYVYDLGSFFEPGYLYRSTDGTAWEKTPFGRQEETPPADEPAVFGVSFGNNFFLAINDNGVWHSEDSRTWTKTAELDGQDVTFVNGRHYVFGSGQIWSSQDGRVWKHIELNSVLPVSGLASGNDRLVAVLGADNSPFGSGGGGGRGGEIQISLDEGATWTNPPVRIDQPLLDIAYINSHFFAVGPEILLTSPDGFNWRSRGLPNGLGGNKISQLGESLHILGSGSVILANEDSAAQGRLRLAMPVLSNERMFQTKVEGNVSDWLQIESTADFQHWTILTNIPVGTVFKSPLDQSPRFFRIKLPAPN